MQKKNQLFRIIRWIILVILIVFLYQVFWPRHYNTSPGDGEVNHLRWQLSTGSTIGYTHIHSNSKSPKPYPVIYLHGGPGGAISRRVIEDLEEISNEGFGLYFYDQTGCGASGRLSNLNEYTVDRHVNDLNEIINKVNSKKVILIGQSWGCILAAAYLAKYPGKIDKVIFTSPGPVFPINTAIINAQAPDSFKLRAPSYTNRTANASASNIRMKAITFFATRFGWKIASDDEVDEYADFLDSKAYKSAVCDTSIDLTSRTGSGFYASIMTYQSLLHIKDFREKIRGLGQPVLILKGQCDNQPWGATSEYLSLFPNHKLVLIPNAGHFINIEQHDRYIREIKNFLLQ